MTSPKVSAQDKKWQQQDDAHTLAAAEQIRNDPQRMKGAAMAAKQMAKEHAKTAQHLNKVAGKAQTSRPAAKPTKKK